MQVIAVIVGILIAIALGWVIIFCLFALLTYTALGIYAGLKFLCANGFIALDALFYLGFDVPTVVAWTFWGLLGGVAIQGCREMQIYGRKGIGILVALAPILLLGFNGLIKNVDSPISSGIKTVTKVEQNTTESERKPITHTQSTPTTTKQTTTESKRKSTTRREPVQVSTKQETEPPFLTQPRKPVHTTTQQNTRTTPTTVPKTSTPSGPRGMVFIPAGEFQMGSGENTDEQPVHTVHIDAFYMDKYEVTNAQYKKFLDANPQWQKDRIASTYHDGDYLKHWNGNNYPLDEGEHPVIYVSWYAAMAYAKWIGKRLPTEAEWEKAARGGLVGKKYPWGDYINSNKANYNKARGGTTPVGNYPDNYGLYDMAGNVAEWCLDEYQEDFYRSAPRQNPIAGASVFNVTTNYTKVETTRVLRGGSWSTLAQSVRAADRTKGHPTLSYFGAGFRCVKRGTSSSGN